MHRNIVCVYIMQENKSIKNVKRCRDGMPKVCKLGREDA